MNIQIIVDSCCDVTDALRNVLSLSLASLKITVGEHFYEDDGTIDTGVLVADMKACRTAPTTACPSPEEYAALMSQADASLVVTLSSSCPAVTTRPAWAGTLPWKRPPKRRSMCLIPRARPRARPALPCCCGT